MDRSFLVLAGIVLLPAAEVSADVILGGDRPVNIHVPPGYDSKVPAPLVLVLHGYSWDGAGMESVFKLTPLSDELGFLVAYPDGLLDSSNHLTWTFGVADVNSGYLRGLIEEAKTILSVDASRIYLFGYSDGAFMSYRMACDHPDAIAAFASLAGQNTSACGPTRVHALEIHGTADPTVSYASGVNSLIQWAQGNGCSMDPEPLPGGLDICLDFPDPDTAIERYASGCLTNASAELWATRGATHGEIPTPSGNTTNLARYLMDWFLKHPKVPEPVAVILLVSPAQGIAPFEVIADGSASVPPEGTSISGYRWRFPDGGEAEGVTVRHVFDHPGLHQPLTLIVSTDDGRTGRTTEFVDVHCPSGDVLPWKAEDVGTPRFPGCSWKEGGCISLRAGGAFLSGKTDKLHFVHREMTGDFVSAARIEEAEGIVASAQIGLMARESLDPAGIFSAMGITISSIGFNFRFSSRTTTGGSITVNNGEKTALPAWVKLERKGDDLIGYSSTDGTTWKEVSRRTLTGRSERYFVGIFGLAQEPSGDSAFEPLRGRACLEGPPPTEFRRGDPNADGATDISDAVAILGYLFLGVGKVPCEQAGDANDDGALDISDAVTVLSFLFLGGMAIEPPFGTCGVDTTGHSLPCGSFPGCR